MKSRIAMILAAMLVSAGVAAQSTTPSTDSATHASPDTKKKHKASKTKPHGTASADRTTSPTGDPQHGAATTSGTSSSGTAGGTSREPDAWRETGGTPGMNATPPATPGAATPSGSHDGTSGTSGTGTTRSGAGETGTGIDAGTDTSGTGTTGTTTPPLPTR